MPAAIKTIDYKLELNRINRFPIKMRNIERRSEFFRPKFYVNKVNRVNEIITVMKTRVEKKTSNDLCSQRKSADVKELASERKGYSEMNYVL